MLDARPVTRGPLRMPSAAYPILVDSRTRQRVARVHLNLAIVVSWLALSCGGWASTVQAGCLRCHAGIEPIATGRMQERIRRLGRRHRDAEGCTVCHGGDPGSPTAEGAHRGAPATLEAAGGPEGFYPNPGAQRVAERTCGQCHEGYAERLRRSVMSTEADVIERNLCAPAWRKRLQRTVGPKMFGRYAVTDGDGPEPSVGSSAYRVLMRSAVAEHSRYWPSELRPLPAILPPQAGDSGSPFCRGCHESLHEAAHGTGCSACHIPYRRGGAYAGNDPTIDRTQPGKLSVHSLQGTETIEVGIPGKPSRAWTGVALDNCFLCHFDVRRVEVSPMGLIHTHYAGRYQEQGGTLLCQDCHTSVELHGDGNIAAANAAQREVRCEDCHGTTESYPWELPLGFSDLDDAIEAPCRPRGVARAPLNLAGKQYPAKDGYLLTSRGNPFGNVVRDGDRVWLHSASGSTHAVTLLKYAKENDAWHSDLARRAKSGTDGHKRMKCTGCHADWAPQCYGCHAESPIGAKTLAP
jgi:hypothetical protein